MPQVSAFRAIGYALDRFGTSRIPDRVRLPEEPPDHPGRVADLTDLACPPYDVIGPEEQAALLARDPRNAVRLELSADPDPHAAAAETLRDWLADGTLVRSTRPRLFYYAHAAPGSPDDPSVHGVLARVLLEAFGDGVRAHEHTMPGPRADRLALLRATRTQLSPTLALYFDGSDRYRTLMSRAWTDEWRARDGDGLLHMLAAIEPDEPLARYLSHQRLFLADGHHRYETALAYQAEIRADPRWSSVPRGELAADWVMMVLVNAEFEELEIRATHRLLRGVETEPLQALARGRDPFFQAIPVDPDRLPARLAERQSTPGLVVGLVLPGAADEPVEGWLLIGGDDAVAARMARESVTPAVRELDLAVLQAIVLRDRLGLDPAAEAGERILYTKDPADAVGRVRSGEAQAALLVRPTRLDQLAAVATAGDVMPEKSTYFYPKLLTGMAFHPLEDA
ncbi:MAG TPA: DUF1015 domain-containing protein [Candidatus Limnocylindria bacterium]|nr:DUF1015 domain-containing protein [Candidatus Limnocylindria bacterium]